MPDQPRQHWIAVLSRADGATLASLSTGLLPRYTRLRGPETGLIMLRGRAGGAGQPFNLGEASVVRCTVRSEGGQIGHAYCMGSELQRAELAAVIDAGLQDEARHADLYESVIAPLEIAQTERRAQVARRAAATQVQFFTMSTMRT